MKQSKSLAVLQKALQDQFPLYKVGLFDVLAFVKQNAKDLPAELNAEYRELINDLSSAMLKQYQKEKATKFVLFFLKVIVSSFFYALQKKVPYQIHKKVMEFAIHLTLSLVSIKLRAIHCF